MFCNREKHDGSNLLVARMKLMISLIEALTKLDFYIFVIVKVRLGIKKRD